MLRSFFLSAVTMTVALSLDMPLPFVPPPRLRGLRFRWRQPLSDLSKNVSSLSVIPENELPSSLVLLQGTQYLVPPVESCLLVDVQGGGYLVKGLLFGHQLHVCLHKPFLVELLLPRAGIFGESPAAILALEALRSVVLAETVVAVASTMRTAALFFQQGRQTRAFRDCRLALIANTQCLQQRLPFCL